MDQTKWAEFRERCDALLDRIDVPRPFTVEKLVAKIAADRGRPLRLLPLPARSNAAEVGICGMWVAFGTVDHVYHSVVTSPIHQTHIVLHELSHILLGHRQSGEPDPSELQQLFPDLDPAMAARLLARGRSEATTEQERETELLASLIWHRFESAPVAQASAPAAAADTLHLMMGALTGRYGRKGTDATV
ncbi:hypothetical protein [Kitasatospora sp. NPDC094015]|uniref:hypothetical protein n=1 Tax=Kitasatospora sp. NPDC094015 TaxID=3155205 RepID=UPI00332AA8DE